MFSKGHYMMYVSAVQDTGATQQVKIEISMYLK